jgi:hypothetical protein
MAAMYIMVMWQVVESNYWFQKVLLTVKYGHMSSIFVVKDQRVGILPSRPIDTRSYFFNSITYKKFDKKKTPKNDIRTITENKLARENKCATLNSIDKHNYNKKLNAQPLHDSEESVHSVDTNMNIRCTNITDDENNNMDLQSKNNKVDNQTKVKIIV